MRGENQASLGQNEYNMNKQKVSIGVRNQGNYNKGMRGNYNNNNMNNNNRINNNYKNDFNNSNMPSNPFANPSYNYKK